MKTIKEKLSFDKLKNRKNWGKMKTIYEKLVEKYVEKHNPPV